MSDSQPLPGTGITAIADPQLRVFYQLLDDHLDQDVCQSPGVWKNDDLHISPVSATPLASVTWNNEKEVSGLTYMYPAPRSDEYVRRFACTISTPTTLSKNFATLMAKAGIRERLAR